MIERSLDLLDFGISHHREGSLFSSGRRMTVRIRGPWAPRTRIRSMSPVRLGPVINGAKLGLIFAVPRVEKVKCPGQIRHNLRSFGDYNVMGRQHRQSAPTRATRRK